MVTIVKGQPPSTEIRQRLKDLGKPVLLAFSGGKDCILAELLLQEAGIETVLVHFYGIPGKIPGKGLQFAEDNLEYLEDKFGKQIHRYPHPSFYRQLRNLVFQPPERCAIIEAADFPQLTLDDMWGMVKYDLGFPLDTWVADGVRAADSIVRRASFTRHGVMKENSWKVSPVYDWLIAELRDKLAEADIKLGVEYDWFGRSFDGLDYRFTKPIRENAPADWEQIVSWFPLIELEHMRREMIENA